MSKEHILNGESIGKAKPVTDEGIEANLRAEDLPYLKKTTRSGISYEIREDFEAAEREEDIEEYVERQYCSRAASITAILRGAPDSTNPKFRANYVKIMFRNWLKPGELENAPYVTIEINGGIRVKIYALDGLTTDDITDKLIDHARCLLEEPIEIPEY